MKYIVLILCLLLLAWFTTLAHAQELAADAVLSAVDGNDIDLVAVPDQRSSTLTEEGTDSVEITFQIDRDVTEPVTVRVFESEREPMLANSATGEVFTPHQCSVRLQEESLNSRDEAVFSLNTASDSQTVVIEAIDDPFKESIFSHTCTVSVERTNGNAIPITVFSYHVHVAENDASTIQTLPEVSVNRRNILEGESVEVFYVFTEGFRDVNNDIITIQLRTETPDICGVRTLSGEVVPNIDLVYSSADFDNAFVTFEVIAFAGFAEADCNINAALDQILNGYNFTDPSDLPDVRLRVRELDADTNDDGKMTPADAVYAINRLGEFDVVADVNFDGTVTGADVDLIIGEIGMPVP